MENEINKEKLKRMMKKIIAIEKEYAQTNEGSDNEIKNKIKKVIEEVAEECY